MVSDRAGIEFLQWCLPKMGLQWSGFRKVRRQVLKRLSHRLQELALPSVEAYRAYLENHPAEWATLATLCWINISRFCRDQSVFSYLENTILPRMAQLVIDRGESELSCWSAGCAAGEEPYTLSILWKLRVALRYSMVGFRVVATDIDALAIQRAERGCYQRSSVKELPAEWRAKAFVASGDDFCLKEEYRAAVTFMVQDIRETMPQGPFHLILCRNLVFTYFDETTQRETLRRLVDKLIPGGALIIGKLESLPEGAWEFEPQPAPIGVYQKPVISTQDA